MTPKEWSLLEIMRVFRSREVGLMVFILKDDLDRCRAKRDRSPVVASLDDVSGRPIPYAQVLKHLRRAGQLCEEISLDHAAHQLAHINTHYTIGHDPVDYSSIVADLRNALDAMLHDLGKRKFLEIAPTFGEFLNNTTLFGDKVSERFSSAVPDMLDRNRPIDLATWEDLLKKLEEAEDAIRLLPRTAAREAQFEFFHGANMEVKRFKNKFRNRIMHSRESYDINEAMSAFTHVRDFMKILASRISERTRTPVIWKGSKWTDKE